MAGIHAPVWRKSDISVWAKFLGLVTSLESATDRYDCSVGLVNRLVTTRQLKNTSTALRRAEAELRVEREQGLSFTDDAADAHGASLGGNAADRDEAFRAQRHLDGSKQRVANLESTVTELRAKQDRLLDRMGNEAGGGSW